MMLSSAGAATSAAVSMVTPTGADCGPSLPAASTLLNVKSYEPSVMSSSGV